jgi:16S rRNA processing protein RimM
LSTGRAQVRAGRVGKAHGLDGSFYVDAPTTDLSEGTQVTVAGRPAVVERRAGTDERPLIRLSDVADRHAATDLHGADLLVDGGDLDEGEYLAEDLVGCNIPGLGDVRRVIEAPSCDLLEVGDEGLLVPFVSDAITRVDVAARTIEVDREFLALDEEEGERDAAGRVEGR